MNNVLLVFPNHFSAQEKLRNFNSDDLVKKTISKMKVETRDITYIFVSIRDEDDLAKIQGMEIQGFILQPDPSYYSPKIKQTILTKVRFKC